MSMGKRSYYLFIYSLLILLFSATLVAGDCTCDHEEITKDQNSDTLKYKLGAIFIILVASALGVCLPIIGKSFPSLHPESNSFFRVKTFAAGVILSTGFIHVLPDAFESLTSPCLKENPWGKFPFTGLAAMVGALGSLMIDAFATGHNRRVHFGKATVAAGVDEEISGDHAGHVIY
ncbi:zinc transporter 1-like [Chenopodium quinoa]|uniref:zinc transporter 1-like n=1 Tax=Chenopodium quinoa TaxID=63459 RepID=UPI000B78F67D|nr:zinc transporter 1-like [Chenopodium quinoa]